MLPILQQDEKVNNLMDIDLNINNQRKIFKNGIFTTKNDKNIRRQIFKNCSFIPEYFSRIIDFRQMDFDSTIYQIVTLCVNPAKVYKSAYYRKQTKNRWARDDPGFAVLQMMFLIVACVAWSLAFKIKGISSYLSILLYSVVFEWCGSSFLFSTFFWWFANNHLREKIINNNKNISIDKRRETNFFVEQKVEWQYAFDIHCNSFFILFLFIYVFQYFLLPIVLSPSFISLVLANTLYTAAFGLYMYITFLGYMALPFLHKTEKLLYPIVAIGGMFLVSILIKMFFGISINISLLSAHYYY